MKKLKFLLLALSFIVIVSCSKDEEEVVVSTNEKRFLVSKIYNYNNQLLAHYLYDGNNRLIKRITTDPVNNRSSDYIFEYENNEVKKIKYIDHDFPGFNHEILIYYNEQGKVIRDETIQNNNVISHNNYYYNSQGKIDYLFYDTGAQNSFINYQNSNNCKQIKYLVQDAFTGELYESFSNYLFDTKQKPSFGIDKIFQIEILPYFGTEAVLPKNISENNMTEFDISGTKWFYEYNENDLPKTIETKWEDITTLEPMLLRLEYIEII
jgi:hypothetical protein